MLPELTIVLVLLSSRELIWLQLGGYTGYFGWKLSVNIAVSSQIGLGKLGWQHTSIMGAYRICFLVYFVAMCNLSIGFTATIVFHYTGTVRNSFPPSNSRMLMHIRKCHQSRHGHSGGVANGWHFNSGQGELSPWSLPVLKVANDIWVYLLHGKKTSKYRKTCQRGSARETTICLCFKWF